MLASISAVACTANKINPYQDETVPPENLQLLDKARQYDKWNSKHRLRPFGGIANTIDFTAADLAHIDKYRALSDANIWTGLYLASQAFRYQVTREKQAEQNIIAATMALHNYLQVTRSGVLSRFVAPKTALYINSIGGKCSEDANTPCITDYYQGKKVFWLGGTSRDQYTGWFWGMSMAYDALNDTAIKQMIKDDVVTVIKQLASNNFIIKPPRGDPAGLSKSASALQRITWSSVAAKISNDPEIIAIRDKAINNNWRKYRLEVFAKSIGINHYGGYVGFNLSHINFYNLIRNETNSCLKEQYIDDFKKLYAWVEHDGTPFFDYIAMAIDQQSAEKTKLASIALAEFPEFPNLAKNVFPPPAKIDKLSIILNNINHLVNSFIDNDKIILYPQAQTPYPIKYRCSKNYLWQQSPYAICCTKPTDDKLWSKMQLLGKCRNPVTAGEHVVYSGIDYLLAYWLGRYHGLLSPEA